MPVAANMTDAVQWVLYDTLLTAAAANTLAQYTFFQVPIGGAKTKAQTNMEQVSRLADPDYFNCQAVGFEFAPNMVKVDIDQFLNAYYCEFWVGQKVYAEGPLSVFPSGAGLSGATTRNNEGTFSNGLPTLGNCFDLRLPAGVAGADGITGITILQGQQFQFRVIGTPFALAAAAAPMNGAGLILKTYLFGIKYRAVQ